MKFSQLLVFIFIATLASCSSSTVEEENELYSITESNTTNTASEEETALLEIINDYRVSIGLNLLKMDTKIYNVASEHNIFMIEDDRISHTNFSLRADKVKKATKARNVSENVARHFNTNAQVLKGWLNSPTHKATLEGNHTHTVISITTDLNGKKYYTQLFYN